MSTNESTKPVRVEHPALPPLPEGAAEPVRIKLCTSDTPDRVVPFDLKIELDDMVVRFIAGQGGVRADYFTLPGVAFDPDAHPSSDVDEKMLDWSEDVWDLLAAELLSGGVRHLQVWAMAAGIDVWPCTAR